MSRYFIELAYNGKDFHGWQVQNNATTVQGVLTNAISLLLKNKDMEIIGCGRTDTGVHAKQYFAHFDYTSTLDTEQLKSKLNRFLPNSIVIYNIYLVSGDLHARFSAISREYKYYIRSSKDPFENGYFWHLNTQLNIEKMNEACNILYEYIDFTSFSKLHTQTKTNNCHIMSAHWIKDKDKIVFTIKADRFLRNMVRAIVGTMIEIGSGKMSFDQFREIIKSKNRSNAGVSVPGHALFLNKIDYNSPIPKEK